MFPASERASDVVAFFERLLDRENVTILTNTSVLGFDHANGSITGIRTPSGAHTAQRYILATGGLSHPETGSTGDGHSWLRELGHTVHEPNPALVPLISPDKWVHSISGTSLEHARITFKNANGKVVKTGRMLFTHFGLSGPAIINAAAEVQTLLAAGPVSATINLFPGMDDAAIQDTVLTTFTEHSNKTLRNTLKHLVPPGMSAAVLALLPADVAETKTHSISRPDRQALITLLRGLPLTVSGTKGSDWSVVANGGLDLAEVDTRTMRSKRYENLHVTGDILHIMRPTGGYSLQLCWTTGAVAARET
jgi:predicted Rossmann fold flavoprotein